MNWKLKEVIKNNNDTQLKLADYLEISKNAVTNKMLSITEWKADEIKKIMIRYKLKEFEIFNIFFKEENDMNEQNMIDHTNEADACFYGECECCKEEREKEEVNNG